MLIIVLGVSQRTHLDQLDMRWACKTASQRRSCGMEPKSNPWEVVSFQSTTPRTTTSTRSSFWWSKKTSHGLNATEKMKLLTVHKENFIHAVENSDGLKVKYPDVFNKDLGTLPGMVHLQVDPECRPVLLRARKVPVSMKEKFKEELQRLENLNVISPVDEPTELVSQIVVALKKSGELRVSTDPKPLNTALKREQHYQIPVIDDLLPDLTDARVFTKADLASAVWQLELDHESSMLTTFDTPHSCPDVSKRA